MANRSIIAVICISVSMLLSACGGGGGGSKHTPAISNLQFSPTSATFRQGGGSVSVRGYVDFSDSDGDLATLRLTSSSAGIDLTIPINGLSGQKNGTIYGDFIVSSLAIGTYAFEVYVTDGDGNSSNRLAGVFEVQIDDTATLWTTRTSGVTANLRDVTWSGTQFVVVGDNGTILTSPDGVTWIARDSGGVERTLNDITWSGTQFVAVGGEYRFPGNPDSNDTLIITSPDGVNWTKRTSGLANRILWGVTWTGSQFIAVSGSEVQPADTMVFTSPDGSNWTQRTLVLGTPYTLFDAVLTGSGLVTVGSSGAVFTSPDGSNWTQFTTPAIMNYGVTWSGNHLVSVGWGIAASIDGTNWSMVSPPTTISLWGIAWGDIQYVVVGDSGTILTSP